MYKADIDSLITVASRTVHKEAEALRALADSLHDNADFRSCIETLVNCRGRIVLTGIGKSAIVAQKIVATLNSTGSPSLFLHAADAIHGDLGMIQPDDCVICLSKSGETSEIKVLIPLLKSFGNPLVAMTANRNSTLARQADFLLWTPVDHEADPNNLAPTTSTISQMALGDALAIVLLTHRGFSAADFAKFHPGGALGKQLYLRVRDLYDRNEKPVVRVNAALNEVILEISAKRLGATAVLDNDDRLAGIITDGDLRRMLQQQTDFTSLKATDILTRSPKYIGPDEMAVDAFALMRNHSITQLIVLDNGKYLGIVHIHDLIREGFV
jgi:arabinose-5-phosphate isomerase